MTNNRSDSRSTEGETTEFYVPATFQFSTEPGVIERLIVGVFHNRDDLEARFVKEEPTKEFYTPAMFQFSTEPGRIEKFLSKVFRERGKQEFRTVPDEFVDIFYLPATNSDLFKRRDDRKRPPVVPAAEVVPGAEQTD